MTPRNQGWLCLSSALVAALAWTALRSGPGELRPDTVARQQLPVALNADSTPAHLPSPECPHCAATGGRDASAQPAVHQTPADASVTLPADFLGRILSPGQETIAITLPGGSTMTGKVTSLKRDAHGLLDIEGTVSQPEPGRFMFARQTRHGKAGNLVGYIHFEKNDTAYQVRPTGPNGAPQLVETTVDSVVCRAYAMPPDEPQAIPPTHPTDYPIPPDENGVIQLQSLPGAAAVVYLDFDGEERDFSDWGYINAMPAPASNLQIYEVWKGVSEDYQPFQINITTIRAVYDAAAPGSRMQVVITPTNTAAPTGGGVAYVGSFNWTRDTVCWSFYSIGKNAVEVISHEVGHTLGLSHDGRTTPQEEYFEGQNGWAPIMGLGYYRTLSQWSKGEYPGANNTQDDLAILSSTNNDVSYRADDHGPDFASATWLDLDIYGNIANEGIITTRTDEDAFRFSTSGGQLTLNIDGVAFNPNLDLKAEIVDSGGAVIASHDPADSLDALFFALDLSAGDYFLRVSGTGKGDVISGYSDYASLGAYTITGTLTGGAHSEYFTVNENVSTGSPVGAVVPRVNHGAGNLVYAISSGNSAAAFAIDPSNGSITVANASLLDFESLSTRWDEPARFELFVEISDSLGIAVETIRTVVTIADLNETPVFPAPAPVLIPENLAIGSSVTQVNASDPDRADQITFSITAGNTGDAFTIDPLSGEITVAGILDYSLTPDFTLTLRASDQRSPVHNVEVNLRIDLVDITPGHMPGTITRTFYRGIQGATVASLTSAPNYPGRPHSEVTLDSFDGGTNAGEYYGSIVRGYVVAPVSGSYTFWLSCDDAGELRISPDTDPVHAVKRAWVTGFTNPNQWTKYSSQKSVALTLTAGQLYYLEAIQKEAAGGDHLQVAWQGPGMSSREIIPGRWLAPYAQDYAPWAGDMFFNVRESAGVGQRVGRVEFLEPDIGQAVSSYAITGGNEAGLFSVNAFSGDLLVAQAGALTGGETHVLTVSATDSGSPPLTGSLQVTVQVLDFDQQVHAWWKLDEADGTAMIDHSGNARHAAMAGAGSRVMRAAANPALQLNGSDAGFTYTGNQALEGATPFTVVSWVKLAPTHAADGVLIQQMEDGINGDLGRYSVVVKSDGRINFSVYGMNEGLAASGYQFDLTSSGSIADGMWHHVACVRDGSDGRIFIDGVQQAAGSGILRLLDPALTVSVGYDARDSNRYLDATLDDVRIYEDALGSMQLARIAGTPSVALISPAAALADVPPDVGLLLEAAASVPDESPPALEWSQVSGPGTLVFGSAISAESTVTFPVPGTYVIRITASHDGNQVTDEVTVTSGSTATSPFTGRNYGGGVAGGHFGSGANRYVLSDASSGIRNASTSDGFYLLGQQFDGDFDLRARATWVEELALSNDERAGLILRSGNAGEADEVSGFIGFDPSSAGYWTRRNSVGAANSETWFPPTYFPTWCRISRSGDAVEFWYSMDGLVWESRGNMTIAGVVTAGLCWTSGNPTQNGSAILDKVSGFATAQIGPMVDAGEDLVTVAGTPVVLTGNTQDDGLPSATAVEWSMTSGPGSLEFGDAGQALTSVTGTVAGDYVLRLVADDGALRTFDEVHLTITPLPPFESWQLSEFGLDAGNPLLAAGEIDIDHDGLTNLMEYALGTDPQQANVATVVHDRVLDAGNSYLRLTIERNPGATDVIFTVEGTDDLSNPVSWSTEDTLIEEDTPARLVVRDTVGGPRRFLRLRVER